MLRILTILTTLCLAAPTNGAAQVCCDTLFLYSLGNIQATEYELQTVFIRPACQCTGPCSCSGALSQEGYRNASIFAAADEILGATQGVTMIRRGNYAMEPGLRSLSGSRINLTIDGMKVFGACTDKMDPVTSYLEPNNLKNLQVAQGTSGARDGSNIGGSVRLNLNEPAINTKTPLRGEAGMGFNSASLGFNSLMSLNYSRQKWAVLLNGTYRVHQDYRAGDGSTVPHSQYRKGNLSASAKWLVTQADILKFDFLLDDARNVGYPALPMDVAYAKANMYAITYKKYPKDRNVSLLETKAYANSIRHAMDDTDRDDIAMHMDMPGQSQTAGAYSKFTSRWNRHSIDVQADGYFNRSLAEMTMYPPGESEMYMLTWPDVRRGNAGVFLQYQYRTEKGSAFQMSVRTDAVTSKATDEQGISQMEVFGYDIARRDIRWLNTVNASYDWNASEKTRLTLSAGYGERGPSVSEQYAFYIFNASDGYDYLGMPDIRKERSLQAELGLAFNTEKFDLKPAAFYYYIKDFISGVTDESLSAMTPGARGVKFYDNLQGAHLAGGSLLATYRPVNGLSLSGQVDYTHGRDNNGAALAQIAPLETRFSVQYQTGALLLTGECEVAARQGRIDEMAGDEATPAYALLNIRATYTFELSATSLKLNAGIENMLDKAYRQHLDWGGILRPGINAYFNVNVAF